MTSRVLCTYPPAKLVPRSGQNSKACTTCPEDSMRLRAKPRVRRFHSSFLPGWYRLVKMPNERIDGVAREQHKGWRPPRRSLRI